MAAVGAYAPTSKVLLKRNTNWASQNPGVILVFCIVFVVGVGLICLFLYRYWLSRRAVKETYPVQEE